ncbi:hypothetical protein [Aquimarina megaterium]|uniref:hypothetical protein n=1 Tax=Aquimarina megaterium TaxID=1443666 RepID=UPI00046E7062|nr:hypothetical protein [Aquimarina megaterium]
MSLSRIEIKIYQNHKKSKGQNHRFNSWNHCFKAFSDIKDTNLLSLHLGFYLASWGMYRGSGSLLQNDYLVHQDAISVIKQYHFLRALKNKETEVNQTKDILDLYSELSKAYEKNGISPTGTLISKVILGTLGCLPAYDRFFKSGAKENSVTSYEINEKSLESLFQFIYKEKEPLKNIQSVIYKKDKQFYPIMKLIDMYFWQLGYDDYEFRKNKKNKL